MFCHILIKLQHVSSGCRNTYFQTEHFNLSEKYEVLDVTEIKSVDQTTSAVDTGQVSETCNKQPPMGRSNCVCLYIYIVDHEIHVHSGTWRYKKGLIDTA